MAACVYPWGEGLIVVVNFRLGGAGFGGLEAGGQPLTIHSS